MRCARATRHFIAETVTQQRSGGLAGHAHAAKGQVMCDMSESQWWTEGLSLIVCRCVRYADKV